MTASGAPFTTSSRLPSRSISTELRRRSKSNGTSSIFTQPEHRYNPVGYVLSANKDAEDEKLQRRRRMTEDRALRMQRQASTRILKNVAGA